MVLSVLPAIGESTGAAEGVAMGATPAVGASTGASEGANTGATSTTGCSTGETEGASSGTAVQIYITYKTSRRGIRGYVLLCTRAL